METLYPSNLPPVHLLQVLGGHNDHNIITSAVRTVSDWKRILVTTHAVPLNQYEQKIPCTRPPKGQHSIYKEGSLIWVMSMTRKQAYPGMLKYACKNTTAMLVMVERADPSKPRRWYLYSQSRRCYNVSSIPLSL